jgi:hypothetical protein
MCLNRNIVSAVISKFTPCKNISVKNNSVVHCMFGDDSTSEMRPGQLIQYSDSLRVGRSGDRISGMDGIFRSHLVRHTQPSRGTGSLCRR